MVVNWGEPEEEKGMCPVAVLSKLSGVEAGSTNKTATLNRPRVNKRAYPFTHFRENVRNASTSEVPAAWH